MKKLTTLLLTVALASALWAQDVYPPSGGSTKKFVTMTVTAAEMVQLNATPVVMLTGTANTVIVPYKIVVYHEAGTTGYTQGTTTDLTVAYDSDDTGICGIPTNGTVLTDSSEFAMLCTTPVLYNSQILGRFQMNIGDGVHVTVGGTGELADGDFDLTIRMEYELLRLPLQ